MANAITIIIPLILMHRMSSPSLKADDQIVLTVVSTASLYQTEDLATTYARWRVWQTQTPRARFKRQAARVDLTVLVTAPTL